MDTWVELYISMTAKNQKDIEEYDPSFTKGVFDVIKKYFLTFCQPPQIGMELFSFSKEDRSVLKVERVRFFSDGGFIIDLSYDDYAGELGTQGVMHEEFKLKTK